jgi:hypothetical protein
MENYYREMYNETQKNLLVAIRTLAGISEAKYSLGDKKEILNRVSAQAQEALDKIMKKTVS